MILLSAIAVWWAEMVSADQLHRLGQTFLHSIWQGAALAALLAGVLRVLPRRSAAAVQLRYVTATLALAAVPLAAMLTYALVEPPRARAGRAAASPALVTSLDRVPAAGAARLPETGRAVAAAADGLGSGLGAWLAQAPQVVERSLPWCGGAWLCGVLVAALRLCAGWSGTRRLVSGAAAPRDPWWQARLRGWQRAVGIDRRIRLLVSAQVDVPMVVGWLRPVVLWPLTACAGLPPDQLDAILVHELAHVRRHDVLVNILQAWVEAAFFHHPAVWWMSAQVRAERECCADELAVRVLAAGRDDGEPRHAGRAHARQVTTRLAYARALLAIEERRQRSLLAVAADGGSLVSRVQRLVNVEPTADRSGRLAAAAMTLLLAGVVAGTAASADGPEPPRAAESAAQPSAAALPKDTNQIESLTPAQAWELTETFPGMTAKIALPNGAVVTNHYRSLPLNGLGSLDAQTAAALAGYRRGPLLLDGLTTLDAATAAALTASDSNEWLGLAGLTTLDVETARALAGSRRGPLGLTGLTRLDPATAEALAEYAGSELRLDGLTTLDAATAAALAKSKSNGLHLSGLTTLDAETARALAAATVEILNLSGLTGLDVETARAFAGFAAEKIGQGRHAGQILLGTLSTGTTLDVEAATTLAAIPKWPGELNGLTALDAAVARALAAYEGPQLSLHGLKTLDVETARALAAYRGELHLHGLATVDAEVARALAGKKVGAVSLAGVTTVNGDVLRALAGAPGAGINGARLTTLDAETAEVLIDLPGFSGGLGNLRRLDADTAAVLGRFGGDTLILSRLPALDAAAARGLAAFKGRKMYLQSVKTLDAEVLRALAAFKGELDLGSPTTVDPATIEALASIPNPGPGGGSLGSVTVLDVETARAIVNVRRWEALLLPKVKTLDAAVASVLASRAWTVLQLGGLTTLDVETALALAEFQGGRLMLHHLETLDPEILQILAGIAGWDGQLERLKTLDTETARALATHRGKILYLPGLTTLDVDAALSLAEFPGRLQISPQALRRFIEKHPLSPTTARAYAALSGGQLPMITAFESPDSVAIARALATSGRPLRLPNLQRISPKTLAALLANQDIEIPLVETLELIAEPDGSPTDDFVDP